MQAKANRRDRYHGNVPFKSPFASSNNHASRGIGGNSHAHRPHGGFTTPQVPRRIHQSPVITIHSNHYRAPYTPNETDEIMGYLNTMDFVCKFEYKNKKYEALNLSPSQLGSDSTATQVMSFLQDLEGHLLPWKSYSMKKPLLITGVLFLLSLIATAVVVAIILKKIGDDHSPEKEHPIKKAGPIFVVGAISAFFFGIFIITFLTLMCKKCNRRQEAMTNVWASKRQKETMFREIGLIWRYPECFPSKIELWKKIPPVNDAKAEEKPPVSSQARVDNEQAEQTPLYEQPDKEYNTPSTVDKAREESAV